MVARLAGGAPLAELQHLPDKQALKRYEHLPGDPAAVSAQLMGSPRRATLTWLANHSPRPVSTLLEFQIGYERVVAELAGCVFARRLSSSAGLLRPCRLPVLPAVAAGRGRTGVAGFPGIWPRRPPDVRA